MREKDKLSIEHKKLLENLMDSLTKMGASYGEKEEVQSDLIPMMLSAQDRNETFDVDPSDYAMNIMDNLPRRALSDRILEVVGQSLGTIGFYGIILLIFSKKLSNSQMSITIGAVLFLVYMVVALTFRKFVWPIIRQKVNINVVLEIIIFFGLFLILYELFEQFFNFNQEIILSFWFILVFSILALILGLFIFSFGMTKVNDSESETA